MQETGEFFKGIQYFILAIAVCCAIYQDVHYLKIKNKLNFFLVGIGVLLSIFTGTTQLFNSLLGMVLPFAIGFIFYALKIFGAGDVKFLMGLGALMGKDWIWNCMIYSILSGGVLALFVMFYRGILWERLKYIWNYFKMLFLTRRLVPYQVLDNQKKQFFPFAIAIACGSVLACIL